MSFTVFPRILALSVGILSQTLAVQDDFDDANDEGWTRFDPLNEVGVAEPVQFTFEQGGYRLTAPVPAVDAAGPARAFSYRAEETHTDFYCAVDILDWDDTVNQAFGILGRASSIGLGQTTGYVCNYNPTQTGSQPGGQFQINRVTDEQEDGTIAAADIKLIKGRHYRMVFIGEGDTLTGMLFETNNLLTPIVTLSVDSEQDERAVTYPSGAFGLFNFYRGGDFVEPHAIPDTLFDNFVLEESADAVSPRLPAVTSTIPASGTNFHLPSRAMEFEVTMAPGQTLTTDSLALEFLRGPAPDQVLYTTQDATSIVGRAEALHPNQLYEVELRILEGETPIHTHRWSFDTFDATRLNANDFIVIEAEDYNYNGGQFQDFPPPSGRSFTGGQVNGNGLGYSGQAAVLHIDYFDTDDTAQQENDYRPEDPVGIRAGSDQVEPGPILHDTLRKKYTDAGAFDYQIFRTEAGEWLNYTRNFPAGIYRIYLRAAGRQTQNVRLDRVTGDASQENQQTDSIGIFEVPNTVTPQRFRYVPLSQENGDPLEVAFDGETTLRLTMDGPDGDFMFRRVLYLNYLMFVPVSSDEPNLEINRGGIFGELPAGTQGTTVSIPFVNTAAVESLQLSGAEIRGENQDHFRVDSFTESVEPGGTGRVVVSSLPQGKEGVFLAELVLTSNDAGDAEVAIDLTTTLPRSNQLLVHFPFDESDGSVATDVSGNRRHGVYAATGNGTFVLNRPALAAGTAAQLNRGDGAAFIGLASTANLPPLDTFTASIWLLLPEGEAQGTLFSKGTDPADPFAVAVAGRSLAWGAASGQVFQTEAVLTPGITQHIVLTYEATGDSAEVNIYIDGQWLMNNTEGPAFNDAVPSLFQIGALNGNIGLQATVDDFQLYSIALDADQVAFLHENPGQVLESSEDKPSPVKITQVNGDGANMQITFQSEANRMYSIEMNATLDPGGWTPNTIPSVVGAELPATETTVSFATRGLPQDFYRIIASEAP